MSAGLPLVITLPEIHPKYPLYGSFTHMHMDSDPCLVKGPVLNVGTAAF